MESEGYSCLGFGAVFVPWPHVNSGKCISFWLYHSGPLRNACSISYNADRQLYVSEFFQGGKGAEGWCTTSSRAGCNPHQLMKLMAKKCARKLQKMKSANALREKSVLV